jgi:PST family polysaccharide transporter
MLTTLQDESKRLLNNTSWLMATEIAAKISRLLVILALAASLGVVEYGTVMLALACHEIFKLILRPSAGAQIIQCTEKQLPKYARNGAVLQWLVCIMLASAQALLATPISEFYDNPAISKMISLMAVVYLFYPIVSIKIFLIQRQGNMRFHSIRNGLLDHVSCIRKMGIRFALTILAYSSLWLLALIPWYKLENRFTSPLFSRS